MIGRMIAMKRLPVLMLSVFLLTLLSLPATAESVTENNQSVSKSVALKVNASDMVDVTITWDDFEYNYNGRTFSTKDNTITVKNNNPQNNILVTPTFVKRDGLAYSDDAFYIYFYGEEDKDKVGGAGANLDNISIMGANSTTFYAVPGGNPLRENLGGKVATVIGDIRITIALNGTNP